MLPPRRAAGGQQGRLPKSFAKHTSPAGHFKSLMMVPNTNQVHAQSFTCAASCSLLAACGSCPLYGCRNEALWAVRAGPRLRPGATGLSSISLGRRSPREPSCAGETPTAQGKDSPAREGHMVRHIWEAIHLASSGGCVVLLGGEGPQEVLQWRCGPHSLDLRLPHIVCTRNTSTWFSADPYSMGLMGPARLHCRWPHTSHSRLCLCV